MECSSFGATDPGRVRENNEDAHLVDAGLSLFMVCDGMGGHAAGEVASSTAIRVVRDHLTRNIALLERYRSTPTPSAAGEVRDLLVRAVSDACARIHRMAQENAARRGMGTTLSLLLLIRRRAFIAHVGDSRIYLLRQDNLHQLTEDHSLVNELLKRGQLTAEEINDLPIKNALTRAVGVYELVEVDVNDFGVLPDDRFLLCSDGLHGYFDGIAAAKALMRADDLRSVPHHCIDFANRGGGRDNITAIVVGLKNLADDQHSRQFRTFLPLLSELEFFQNLTYKELMRVADLASAKTSREGEVVQKTGMEPALNVVVTGSVLVRHGTDVVARILPGRYFGLLQVVTSASIELDYVAEQNTQLLRITKKDLLNVLSQDSRLAAKMLWNITQVLALRSQLGVDLGEAENQGHRLIPLLLNRSSEVTASVAVEKKTLEPPQSPPRQERAPRQVVDLTDDAKLIEATGVTTRHPLEPAQTQEIAGKKDLLTENAQAEPRAEASKRRDAFAKLRSMLENDAEKTAAEEPLPDPAPDGAPSRKLRAGRMGERHAPGSPEEKTERMVSPYNDEDH